MMAWKNNETRKAYDRKRREDPVVRAREAAYNRKWSEENREHKLASIRQWHADHPDYHRKRKYGLDQEGFETMLLRQNGLCVVCPKEIGRTAHVDHDHTTGEIRGLLCDTCNRGIGYFKDSPQLLRQAAAYLEQQQWKTSNRLWRSCY